jgi:cytochrome c-type biogenesis protein CcmH/NrfG
MNTALPREASKKHGRDLSVFYKYVTAFAFLSLVFLIPLFALPGSAIDIELQKQTAFLVLASFSFVAWLGSMVATKTISFKKSWAFIPVLFFLVSAGISTLLSIAPHTSLLGYGGQEYTSFLSLLGFGLFFFVGVHLFSSVRLAQRLWFLLILSGGLLSIVNLIYFFDPQLLGTNLIGTPIAATLVLSVLAILGSSLWLVADTDSETTIFPKGLWGYVTRISILLTAATALLYLIEIDFNALWVSLLVGLIVFFIFTLLRAQEFPSMSYFVLPMLLFVVSLLFLFLPSPLSGHLPTEVTLQFGVSTEIAAGALFEHGWLFGSGLGTYALDYSAFHPEGLNNTVIWDATLDRVHSHFMTLLPTFGIAGALAFILFIGMVVWMSIRTLLFEKTHVRWKMVFVAFSGWLVLTAGLFLYPSNFTLSFLFWLLSAVLLSQADLKSLQMPFAKSPRLGLAVTFSFVLVLVGTLLLFFATFSRYASASAFEDAGMQRADGASLVKTVERLDLAAALDKTNDVYYRSLSSALLLLAEELSQQASVDTDAVSDSISASLDYANRAMELSSQQVLNWSHLGRVYTDIASVTADADLAAISAYKETVRLAPNHPRYHALLGQAYLLRANRLIPFLQSEDEELVRESEAERTSVLASAASSFEEALRLKADYAAAQYYLALTRQQQGDLDSAIARIETLLATYPGELGAGFELAILYIQVERFDDAILLLEQIVAIDSEHSNARWYLSALYEQNGLLGSAIKQLEVVADLNPDNEAVAQRLLELEAGVVGVVLPEPLDETGEEDIFEGSALEEVE